MPRRVPVVLSQSPLASPERRQIEEQLVTRLLFESGIDVNVIEHLGHLEPGGTGVLCLEGLTGDVILLGWEDSSRAMSNLAAHRITGRLGRTRTSNATADSSPARRTIYYLDLTHCPSLEETVAEIQRIRDDLSVTTVPLMGLVSPDPASRPLPNSSEPSSNATAPPLPSAVVQPPPTTKPIPARREMDESELDRLVDQLDELDV